MTTHPGSANATFGGQLYAGDVLELRPLKVAGRGPNLHDSLFADARFAVVERTGNDVGYAVWVRHPPCRECGATAAWTREAKVVRSRA